MWLCKCISDFPYKSIQDKNKITLNLDPWKLWVGGRAAAKALILSFMGELGRNCSSSVRLIPRLLSLISSAEDQQKKKNPKPVGFFSLNQRPCYETVVLLVSSFAVWHKHYQSVDSGSDNLVFQPLINKHKFPQKMKSNFVLCTFFKLILCFLVRRINRIQQEKGFLCGWDSKKGCVHLLHSLRIQGHRGAFGMYILALNGTGKATPGFVVFFL